MSVFSGSFARADRLAAWRLLRSGSLPENPSVFTQRVNSFASGVLGGRRSTEATLLVVRDEQQITPYVIAEDSVSAEQGMRHLADATGGVAERLDELPDPFPASGADPAVGGSRVLGRLRARPTMTPGKATQAGADPGEISRRLVAAMPVGSFVAITFRAASRLEVRRTRNWFRHRLAAMLPQHYVSDPSLLVASFVAGAAYGEDVRALLSQVASTIPGFDIEYRVALPVPRSLPIGAGGVMGAGAFSGVEFGVHGSALAALGAAVPPAVYGLGCAAGVFPPGRRVKLKDVERCRFRRPRHRAVPPSKPRQESLRSSVDGHGNMTTRLNRERAGDYPLARDAFAVSPSMIAGLVAPQAGAASGASRTSRKEIPAPLRARIGPGIGYAGTTDVLTHLPVFVEEGSVFATGRQGSGKSLMLYAIYGWYCRDRVQPSGVFGSTGQRNSLIAFESAGPGALDYMKWARAMGDEATLIELTDPSSAVIDILDVPGMPNAKRALLLTDALVYCFGDDSIGVRQIDTLKQVLEAGMTITPEIVNATENLRNKVDPVFAGSPIYYAHVLLGRFGDAMAVELATALAKAAAENPDDAVLRSANEALAPLFGQRTMAQRREYVDPVRNKIRPLLDSGNWFAPRSGRRHISWHEILNGHKNVVINMGSASDGSAEVAEESVTTTMLSLLMYTMNQAVRRYCAGWLDKGRSVTIFSDELSEITVGGDSVIAWNLDKGRKYGVRQVLATQRPEQLSEDLRTCMMGFPNAVYLQQRNAEVIARIATQLAPMDPEMTPEMIARLERYTAIVTTTVNGNALPPVTVRLPNWSADMARYAQAQGWPQTSYADPDTDRFRAVGPVPPAGLPPLPSTPPVSEDAGW